MKERLIGVIVPVYKVEKYVAECIESILAQTYTKFRLILVDDGTPDNAGKICDEYAKKDQRITVIHQENTGVTRARAKGVEEANDCEFITFIDADDTIPHNSLQQLYHSLSSLDNQIDIVLGYRTDCFNGVCENYYNKLNNGVYNSVEYINALLADDCIIGPICKLIRHTLFTDETFAISREVVQFEDVYMNIVLGLNAKNILIDNSIHAYIHRADSTTSQIHRNGYMKEEGWYSLLSSIKTILLKKNIIESTSENFSRFAYSKIFIYNRYYKKRFKKCSKLYIPIFNKSQRNIFWSNRNILFFHLFNIIQKIKLKTIK